MKRKSHRRCIRISEDALQQYIEANTIKLEKAKSKGQMAKWKNKAGRLSRNAERKGI
jgi:hypothetical protein